MSTVRTIIERKGGSVAAVDRATSVQETATLMGQRRTGSVVVLDGPKVVGIFTERDLLMRVVAKGLNANEVRIDSVMTAPVAVCSLATTIAECRAAMTAKHIRHLPVVENGVLAGIVTSRDLMAYQAAEDLETIHYLRDYLYSSGGRQ